MVGYLTIMNRFQSSNLFCDKENNLEVNHNVVLSNQLLVYITFFLGGDGEQLSNVFASEGVLCDASSSRNLWNVACCFPAF